MCGAPERSVLCHDPPMRWVGVGSQLWHVRVDLIAPDGDGWRVEPTHRALLSVLTESDDKAPDSVGADQGTGVEGQPVIGLTFWVRADDVGGAATTAVSTAIKAGADGLAGPAFYDV